MPQKQIMARCLDVGNCRSKNGYNRGTQDGEAAAAWRVRWEDVLSFPSTGRNKTTTKKNKQERPWWGRELSRFKITLALPAPQLTRSWRGSEVAPEGS